MCFLDRYDDVSFSFKFILFSSFFVLWGGWGYREFGPLDAICRISMSPFGFGIGTMTSHFLSSFFFKFSCSGGWVGYREFGPLGAICRISMSPFGFWIGAMTSHLFSNFYFVFKFFVLGGIGNLDLSARSVVLACIRLVFGSVR